MASDVFVSSRNIIFWDHVHVPSEHIDVYIGNINEDLLRVLVVAAKKQDLKFLNTFDHFDNAVFNQKQMRRLAQELRSIKIDDEAVATAIDTILSAVTMALERPGLYVKFEAD